MKKIGIEDVGNVGQPVGRTEGTGAHEEDGIAGLAVDLDTCGRVLYVQWNGQSPGDGNTGTKTMRISLEARLGSYMMVIMTRMVVAPLHQEHQPWSRG